MFAQTLSMLFGGKLPQVRGFAKQSFMRLSQIMGALELVNTMDRLILLRFDCLVRAMADVRSCPVMPCCAQDKELKRTLPSQQYSAIKESLEKGADDMMLMSGLASTSPPQPSARLPSRAAIASRRRTARPGNPQRALALSRESCL